MNLQEFKKVALYAAQGTAPANFSKESVEQAFRDGLKERAGSINQFMKNRYDIYETIIQAADAVVPKRIVDALAPIAEIKQVEQGSRTIFKTKTGRDRGRKFVTKAGLSGVYDTFRLDSTTFEVPVSAIGGGVTIDFERMLDGNESLAESMELITEGMTESIFNEVQKALGSSFNATARPAANKYSGSSFDADEMVRLANIAKAYGNGAVIFATPEFIAAMGADLIVAGSDAYQGIVSLDDINSIHNTGLIQIFRGIPVVQIPQTFPDATNSVLTVDPQLAYILPTGGEKVVKVVLEGQTQMQDFQNTDGSFEVHAYKKMGCGIISHNDWAIYQNTGIQK